MHAYLQPGFRFVSFFGGAFALLLVAFFSSSNLSAQTIVISNPGFEDPTPTVFDDYTVEATGWTRTSSTINSGTFDPSLVEPPTLPGPIDGSQVGYADGFGGLQQVLGDTFAPNQLYTFSVYIGYRSDAVDAAPQGTGAITIGYLDSGTFTPLSTRSIVVNRGDFNAITGAYQPAAGVIGESIVIQLTSETSFQVLFDAVQLTASPSAIPEPTSVVAAFGAAALAAALVRRSRRAAGSPPSNA